MHKVYENDDVMMHFKKRYCHCCGKVLQTRKTERIVRKGDPEHSNYCHIGTKYRPHGDIMVIGREYYCPSCDKVFSCDEQGDVIVAQRYYNRKIVAPEEIENAKSKKIQKACKQIGKMRWLLFIPVLGGLICQFKIFNGCLNVYTKEKDIHKLTLSAILVFIGVALAIKIGLFFANVELLKSYETILMLIPSLFFSNIPILWYINRILKKKNELKSDDSELKS